VELDGKVIGINSVKYVGYGIEGMSFSIPVNTVQYVLNQFEKYGKVRRPFLGADLMEGVAAKYGLPSDEGLTISKVKEESPAEKAGIKPDDILISVNKVKITTKIDYNEEMKKYLPGNTAEFLLNRDGKEIKVKITFGETV
jgi:serine protease Do